MADDVGSVVLLHSSGMSGEQWRRTVDALNKSGFQAVAPDFLGAGRNPPWPDGKPFRFEHDVELVARLLKAIGQPVHLIGHSYGGLIAAKVAALDPSRIRSLALYDPVTLGVLEAARDADAIATLAKVPVEWGDSPAEREAWLRGFVEYWGGAGAWAQLREPMRAEFMRVGWVVFEGVSTLIADTTRADAYRSLHMPTLLMTGELSPLAAGRIVERLGEAISGARIERIAGAGHMGPLTHGKQINELIAAHLAAASN